MAFEKEASFGKSLFFGEILEDQIFPYPEIDPQTKETVISVTEMLDKYLATLDSAKMDREGEIPKEVIQQLKELGLFGLIVPMR